MFKYKKSQFFLLILILIFFNYTYFKKRNVIRGLVSTHTFECHENKNNISFTFTLCKNIFASIERKILASDYLYNNITGLLSINFNYEKKTRPQYYIELVIDEKNINDHKNEKINSFLIKNFNLIKKNVIEETRLINRLIKQTFAISSSTKLNPEWVKEVQKLKMEEIFITGNYKLDKNKINAYPKNSKFNKISLLSINLSAIFVYLFILSFLETLRPLKKKYNILKK